MVCMDFQKHYDDFIFPDDLEEMVDSHIKILYIA
jgi:hypothetical protein